MSQQRPASVTWTVWAVVGLMVLTGVIAVLTLVLRDELVDAWRSGKDDASSVQTPAFVPVALVMFLVVASLAFVLLEFFRARHGWARVALTVLALVLLAGMLSMLRIGPPFVFSLLAVLTIVLDAVVVVLLWHRDTTAYLLADPDRAHPGGP